MLNTQGGLYDLSRHSLNASSTNLRIQGMYYEISVF